MILKWLYPLKIYPGMDLFSYSQDYFSLNIQDISLILKLIHNGYEINTLKEWYKRLYGETLEKENLQKSFVKGKDPTEKQLDYMYKDVLAVLRIYFQLKKINYWWYNTFTKEKVYPFDIYNTYYKPLISECIDTFFRGLTVDINVVNLKYKKVLDKLISSQNSLTKLIGFDSLKIKSGKTLEKFANPLKLWGFSKDIINSYPKTNTGLLSYSFKELNDLKTKFPELNENDIFINFLSILKNKSLLTKINTFKKEIINGRVYFSLNLCGAKTFRIITSKYNIQGLSYETELKESLLPNEGNIFLKFDISQEEVRIMAEISKDEKLLEIFNNKKDFHSVTASAITKMSYDKFLNLKFDNEKSLFFKDTRFLAKILNFGLFYGMQPKTLQKSLLSGGFVLNSDKVNIYWDIWNNTYSGVKSYQSKMLNAFYESSYKNDHPPVFVSYTKEKKNHFYITSLKGRKKTADYLDKGYISKTKFYYDLKTETYKKVNILNEACNFPIQATGSDILFEIYLLCIKKLKNKARVILTVHDSVTLETKIDFYDDLKVIIEEIIEEVGSKILPNIGLEADFNDKENSYTL